METKDSKKYQEYIKMRNQAKGLVRKAKANMEKEIAKITEKKSEKILAIRKFKEKNKIWNIRTEIQERKRGGEQNVNRQRKSRSTSSVFTNEPDGEISNIEPITIEHDCLGKFFQEKEVLKLLQDPNVNKSPGPDGLHPTDMLKELSEALVKPLTIKYNTSLTL